MSRPPAGGLPEQHPSPPPFSGAEPIVQSMLPFNVPVAMDLKRAAAASKLEPITVMAASPRPVSADSTGGAASDPCSPCAADARARGSADALPSMALGGPAAARVTCPTPAIGPFPALPISALAAPTGAPAVLAPAALAAALMAQGGAVGAVPLGLFAAAAAAGGAAVVMPPLPAALLCSAAATGAAGGGGIGGSSEPVLAAASSEPNNNNSHGCSQADRSELRRARRCVPRASALRALQRAACCAAGGAAAPGVVVTVVLLGGRVSMCMCGGWGSSREPLLRLAQRPRNRHAGCCACWGSPQGEASTSHTGVLTRHLDPLTCPPLHPPPSLACRMLSNRESARRSRKRKQEHLTELEHQVRSVCAFVGGRVDWWCVGGGGVGRGGG